MLWRRFKVFAGLWWRLYAWGQSRTQRLVKVIGLALTVFGIPTLLTSNLTMQLLLNNTPYVFTVSVGKLIAVVLLVAWALITGALAWERSGVPVLIVDDHLEWDGLRYRLRLSAKDKPVDTSVRLIDIVDITGRRIFEPSRLNIDLDWTHHSGQGAVHIEANETESVSVATIRKDGRNTLLRFTGATYSDDFLVINKAFFHLRIAKPKPQDLWFCFTPDGDSFNTTQEAPPPQSLSQSPTRELTE
jgi:hypothetical protein